MLLEKRNIHPYEFLNLISNKIISKFKETFFVV